MGNSFIAKANLAGTFLLGGDLPIHRLGFGAMRLAGDNIWGESSDPKTAISVLHRVIELGVNFIDTADSYGPEVSENYIAQALYPYPSGLVIATKGGLTRPGPERWVPLGRPDYLMQCVEMSLRRLRVDCIDLYQLHAIDRSVPFQESLAALKQMKQQGKIRHLALSNVSVSEIKEAQKIITVASVQNHYNLSNRQSESVLNYCEEQNIAFIPWYPLASGHLDRFSSVLKRIAKQKAATPAQIALAWLLKRSPVMIPIPGTSSIAHLEENVAAASIELTDQEFKELGDVA